MLPTPSNEPANFSRVKANPWQQTETKIPLFSHHSLFSREKETNDTNGSANH